MRTLLTLLMIVAASLSPPVLGDDTPPSSLIQRTERFEFHSHFWLNLHHFLYRLAQQPEGSLIEGGRSLTRDEFQQLAGAINGYRETLADLDLLLDDRMYAAKRVLIGLGPEQPPHHEALDADHRAWLEAAAPVYRKHYWPRHDLQNREMVSWQLQRVREMEQPVLGRISELAQQPWPEEIIRVDLSWDSNWAGAYCTTHPIHAVITSRPGGPDNRWSPAGWLEILFHEPSHALIDPGRSTVGQLIAERQGMEDTGQLWHAVLFLFSGVAVQEALRDDGVEHQLLMVSEGIFTRYHDALFGSSDAYVAGEEPLEAFLEQAVGALVEKQ